MKNKPEVEFFTKNSKTGCIVFPSGHYIWGEGFGSQGITVAEICFNTSMTGYQEILTDLSYTGQIVNFTFPHIGNTGTNLEDNESNSAVALGMLARHPPTNPSHWKAKFSFDAWLKKNKVIGLGNIDTRRVTRLIRSNGAQVVAICHSKSFIDIDHLRKLVHDSAGLKGKELTASVTCSKSFIVEKTRGRIQSKDKQTLREKVTIVAIDFGAKKALFDRLKGPNRKLIVVPAYSSFAEIIKTQPDGIFLSNGPGDPKATFDSFGKVIVKLLKQTEIPIFGICLGHQILGLAAGAKTMKMAYGHHGANHPVLDMKSGKVEITSMNHGFAINQRSLPDDVFESHISLFDRSNCGIELPNRNCFSVQYHPEASPGPRDSYYLFEKFFNNITSFNSKNKIA